MRDILSSTPTGIEKSRRMSRHTDIKTSGYTYRQLDIQKEIQTTIQTHIQTDRDNQKSSQPDIKSTHSESRTDRIQTVRYPDRQTSKQKVSKQPSRQTTRVTVTQTQRHKIQIVGQRDS